MCVRARARARACGRGEGEGDFANKQCNLNRKPETVDLANLTRGSKMLVVAVERKRKG